MGRSQLSVNSSVLLLGSLPGRTSVRLGRQLELQWSSGAPDALDNHGDEMIFLHKGECTDGSCPAPKRLQVILANAAPERARVHIVEPVPRSPHERASNFPCKNAHRHSNF